MQPLSMNSGRNFASSCSAHPLATQAVGEAVGEVLEALNGAQPDLVVWFATSHHVGAFEDIHSALQSLLNPRSVIAATSVTAIGGETEIENAPGLSIFAATLPDNALEVMRLEAVETIDGLEVTGWADGTGEAHTLLLLADPFSFPVDVALRSAEVRYPGLLIVGGNASAGSRPGSNRLVLNNDIYLDGGVAIAISGGEPIRTVVSQGCRPLGVPFTVTASNGQFIETLGGKTALQRLREVAAEAEESDRELLRDGVHLGVAVKERNEVLGRGDFLMRTVIGGDSATGAIAIGAHVEVGTTAQFQVRDASSALEDLALLLDGVEAGGVLMFTCNGRGTRFFSLPNKDAEAVQTAMGPLPLAGMACAGEIGPISGQNHLHGFTASLALFPR